MTIQTIRVVSKYIRTCERFADFLQENIRWVVGGLLDMNNLDSVMFALNNAQHLKMHVQGNDSDLLALTVYGGMSPHVTVTYLERFVDDGEEYFSPLGTEDFPRADLAKAIECFMTRWFSANPGKAINPVVRNTRKAIMDFLLKPLHELPVRIHEPVDFTRTPEQIRECLTVRKMTKEYGLLRTKHLDTRVEYVDGNGCKITNIDVRNLCEEVDYTFGTETKVVAPDTDEPIVLSPRLQEAFNMLSKEQKAAIHVVSSNPHGIKNPRDHMSYAVKRSADSLPDTDDLKVVFKDGVVVDEDYMFDVIDNYDRDFR